ncbi:MAG: exodeoxyribonuclease VII small subunit [Chloroflexi bacterium 54-19]|nr:MAG: exodeoxyribonuclease VII small subunit [Chloroflexi bacterium 54-19]
MENGTALGAEAIQKLSFEEAYERLNETAARLERGNLSLELSLALYEEGVLLSQHCENLLDKAELRVSQVAPLSAGFGKSVEASDDEDDEDDFTGDDDDDTGSDDDDDEDEDPLARLF